MSDRSRSIPAAADRSFDSDAKQSVGSAASPATSAVAVDAVAVDQRLRLLSATIDLQIQLDDATELSAAANVVVHQCRESLACKEVILAWRDRPESNCHVLASSDSFTSPHSDAGRRRQAAAEEVAARSATTTWPPQADDHRHAMLAVAQYAREVAATSVTAVSLGELRGHTRGSLIVIDAADQDATLGFLETVAVPLASKLGSLQRSEPTRTQRLVQQASTTFQTMRRTVVLYSLAALLVLMLIPLRYKVRADCELQPVQRRFIAAPLDGPLSNVEVRPGDTVAEGDLLATINPREIEYELASVRAEWNRADQEKKTSIAKHDFAASQIASLESDRLKSQAGLLEYRRDNLEIRSPIDGVVVAGDLKKSEGTPVKKGETLFEVAPLGKMIVEVAIPEHEWSSVREGMPVTLGLHALPGESLHGSLQRVHPRAELRDQENVFIGEVLINDPDGILRPGMRGRCWIACDRHPLGWNLFHRAFDVSRLTVRSTLGW
tara:strand:+ start:11880 stop:13361 length:1482 start_codon:yes stop_codon:yes gene_type:complete